jgi:hypothetical protein
MKYRYRGNQSKLDVYSDKTFETLQKVKQASIERVTANISKGTLLLMEKIVGKQATREKLLQEFINNQLINYYVLLIK